MPTTTSTTLEQLQDRLDSLHAQLVEQQQRIAELEAANRDLENASRIKDDLLSTIGHELRTPLNAMLSLVHILQEQLDGVLTERQRESFRVIEASGQHLLELINEILDLSKLQAGKMRLKIESVEVEPLCAEVIDLVRQLAEQKRLQISVQRDERVGAIQADRLRVKQILVNLLSNAVKFTPEGGSVGVEILGAPEREQVQFVVWDTGVGIAEEDMPLLFKPFVQIDNELSQQNVGSGLGLALSQRLARQHGGDILVESKPGVGSRFTLELPWKPSDVSAVAVAAEKQAAVQASAPQRRRLVLLAEDNEANVYALSEYLSMYGVPVVVARTGPEALDLTIRERPGLVLMDINLPRLDGLEVIRRLRAVDQFVDLPIAVITALSGDNERLRQSGANHFLNKPIDLAELDRLLDQYFTQQ
ncbi:hybrid sensor histidine kinase/response regulator [Caldilinea sp.]|uniref:hybrid sensor histidine kinase/response regulator n=1 Tax=Caldilinea sp. TaxID=2293560 RepID=UPI0021DDB7BB|nr:ATP-binding protein [Caldilinea sp.]GIV67695.1 MAG: hybrid sensor histidine kinase/response regulator [Caldilinea sp.]